MAHLLPTLSGNSNLKPIPLQDIGNAIRKARSADDVAGRDAPSLPRPSSPLHGFVATDSGIADVLGMAGIGRQAGQRWAHNRSSAFSNTKSGESLQGLFLPCLTYGKAQSELGQAKQGRTGEGEPANSNGCNASCLAYAAISTVLPCEFACYHRTNFADC